MTPELLTRLREQLEAEQQSLLDELRAYGADPHGDSVERLRGIDEGFADSAAATAERSETLALIDSHRERLGEVEDALKRMAEGTYGTCVDCGDVIPEARLEVRPLSVRCVRCAAARG